MTRAGRARTARVGPLAAIVLSFFAGVIVDGYLRTYGPPLPSGLGRAAASAPLDDAAAGARPNGDATSAPRIGAAPPSPPPRTLAPAPSSRVNAPVATTGNVAPGKLRVPIDGAKVESWKGSFDERRAGGKRGHEAVDILSPRNTPVHAVENGTIAKIFESKDGGHTIYQFSADGRLVYYYAHLERYADGLNEGQAVGQGDVIG